MSDLDKMFKDFENRGQREQEASEQERLKRQQLKEKTIKVLREIVLPVLQELSAAIQQRGYESSVTEKFKDSTSPSVELSFTAKIKESDSLAFFSESKLGFAHAESGQIEVKQEIGAKQKMPYGYDHGRTIPLSDINQDWVRSNVEEFIESVLKAN